MPMIEMSEYRWSAYGERRKLRVAGERLKPESLGGVLGIAVFLYDKPEADF